MMMRSTLPILLLIAALTSGAGAQSIGIDPQTLRPGLPFRTNAYAADNFRRLPYQILHLDEAEDARGGRPPATADAG